VGLAENNPLCFPRSLPASLSGPVFLAGPPSFPWLYIAPRPIARAVLKRLRDAVRRHDSCHAFRVQHHLFSHGHLTKNCSPHRAQRFSPPDKSGRLESLKSQHRRVLKDSGVKPFVLYSMRHTMLTRLGEAGADAFAIQNIAGHSSILISQRYVHPTPEKLERAFTALELYNEQKRREADALKPTPMATLQ